MVTAGSSTGETAITRSMRQMRALRGCAATRSMKLPPSEKPREHHRHVRETARERAHRADHFRQPAGMEQLAVQMVRGAVIAQIEAHDLEARCEQGLRQRQHVGGVGAALPAVQQHGEALARLAAALRGTRVECLQRHAVAAVEQQLVARRAHRHGAPLDARATRRQAGRMVWKCGPRSQRRGRNGVERKPGHCAWRVASAAAAAGRDAEGAAAGRGRCRGRGRAAPRRGARSRARQPHGRHQLDCRGGRGGRIRSVGGRQRPHSDRRTAGGDRPPPVG